jgi:hypothetical protein
LQLAPEKKGRSPSKHQKPKAPEVHLIDPKRK